MRKQPLKLALTATFGLALVFTFSCSGDGGGGDSSSSEIEQLSSSSITISSSDGNSSSSSETEQPDSSNSEIISSSSENVLSSSSSSSEAQKIGQLEDDVFTDLRDGKKYRVEKNSYGQIWMSENLNYSKNNTLGYCYGVDINGTNSHRDSTTCNNGYGRIYEWSVAMDGNSKQGLCPNGWHVPDSAEWDKVVNRPSGSYARMSKGFYIYPGNYNLNAEYPPVGWKERDINGFYWTSSTNSDFIGFWDRDVLIEYRSRETAEDYFSVRCIADNDFKPSCGTNSFTPATQSCCGGKVYNLNTEFCSDALVYAKCNGKTFNTATQECVNNTISSKGGNHLMICTDEKQFKCSPDSLAVQNNECIDLEFTQTNNMYMPDIKFRCEGYPRSTADTLTPAITSISIKVGSNPVVIVESSWFIENSVTVIPKPKIETIEVPDICVQFTSNKILNSVKCRATNW